jgi:hypothetical protein
MGMEKPRKTLDDFPHFVVSEVQTGGTISDCIDFNLVGHFEGVNGVTAGLCWLLLPEQNALYGNLSGLDPQTGAASFNATAKTVPAVQGARLPYLSAYWQAYHIWMILNEDSRWEKIGFHAVDAISESFTSDDGRHYHKLSKAQPGKDAPADAQVVASGWDHEHCELCNAHIDPGDNAYKNTDGLWVCLRCFENYVNPKNLSFVDEL